MFTKYIEKARDRRKTQDVYKMDPQPIHEI